MVLTVDMDTSRMANAIPKILAFGRRTLQQQCVTSVVFICRRAQELTPAASIARIDAELDRDVTPQRKTNGSAHQNFMAALAPFPITVGMKIVIARMNPGSKYSRETGNRWPLAKPNTKGRMEFLQYVLNVSERMRSSRHSSTHYLQTGWTPAIMIGIKSDLFRYNPAFGSRRAGAFRPNSLNDVDPDALGGLTIDVTGDTCFVVASNDVGEPTGGSNAVLAKKHREALIRYGTPAANQAIAEEVAGIEREVERRFALGWKTVAPELN